MLFCFYPYGQLKIQYEPYLGWTGLSRNSDVLRQHEVGETKIVALRGGWVGMAIITWLPETLAGSSRHSEVTRDGAGCCRDDMASHN